MQLLQLAVKVIEVVGTNIKFKFSAISSLLIETVNESCAILSTKHHTPIINVQAY